MFINDQVLSAFLDNELGTEDAEKVREYIANNEAAATRLAQLAMADQRVCAHVDALSATPMPRQIVAMLDDNASSRVTPLRPTGGIKSYVQQHLALAASVALVVGFGFGYVFHGTPNTTMQTQIAAVLEQQPSGASYTVADGTTMKPQLTFANTEGEYCRQYELQNHHLQTAEVAIQCRRANSWQLVAMAQVPFTNDSEYRPANAQHALDSVLDQIMSAAPLNAEQEQVKLQSAWRQTLNSTQTEEH